MDIGQALSILRLNWDVPLRVLVSIATVAMVVGLFFHRTALQGIGDAAHYFDLTAVGDWFMTAHGWLQQREPLVTVVGLVFLAALLFIGRRRRRGPDRASSSFLLGVCLLVEVGHGTYPLFAFGAVFVIWLAACIYRIWAIRAYNYRWGDGGEAGGAIAVESYIRRTWIGPVIATLFVIVAPLTWFFA